MKELMVGIILILVCIPKRRNLPISDFSRGLQKGVETHRNSGMEMEKKCSSCSLGNEWIFGARRRGDLYYLDNILLSLSFEQYRVWFLSYQ